MKDQANAAVLQAYIRPKVNRRDTVDYLSANQGFTGPGGHPVQIAEQFMNMGILARGPIDPDFGALTVN